MPGIREQLPSVPREFVKKDKRRRTTTKALELLEEPIPETLLEPL